MREARHEPKDQEGRKNTCFSIFAFLRKSVMFEFRGSGKGAPEGPKSVPSRPISVTIRENKFLSQFSCVCISDVKFEMQEVAQGPGPHRPKRDFQNRNRCQCVFPLFCSVTNKKEIDETGDNFKKEHWRDPRNVEAISLQNARGNLLVGDKTQQF